GRPVRPRGGPERRRRESGRIAADAPALEAGRRPRRRPRPRASGEAPQGRTPRLAHPLGTRRSPPRPETARPLTPRLETAARASPWTASERARDVDPIAGAGCG